MLFRRTNRTLKRLEKMLEDAVNGEFQEEKYDESRLSRLEARWKRFFAASALSARRIREERDSVKSLISDISHQTKTPLANILLYTELLKEREKDPELLKMVDRIREQSEKLDFLLRSLIKISRLENGIFTLHPVQQSVSPMLEAVMEQTEAAASAKGIRLILETQETQKGGEAVSIANEETKKETVRGSTGETQKEAVRGLTGETDKKAAGVYGELACFDRKWTEEALYNLAENAVKYSPAGTRIRFGIRSYELFVAVYVKDQGIGIREGEQAQIFGRFYRSRDVEQEPGVGVGLYLAGKLASMQGGYLDVDSVYGQGSTFFLYIPRESRTSHETGRPAEGPETSRKI